MTDTADLKTFDPFAMPAAPVASALDDARLDEIGARHGFDTAPETPAKPKAAKAKPKAKPKPKPKPKPPAPEVRRMRTHTPVPKAQFNQRVSVEVANGFYDYQRETGLPMGTVLEHAFQALMEREAKRAKD
jgi:hypothetical protein